MYGKIFESMYDGTLSADWKAMVTFQQFIVLADSEGIVDYTPEALNRRTGIPLDIIEHGIATLQEPDQYSRSSDYGGKRIALLDDRRPWGWSIVNYAQYRDMATREDLRAEARERKRKQRERQAQAVEKNGPSQDVTGGHDRSRKSRHADADADTDADTDKLCRAAKKVPKGFALTPELLAFAKKMGMDDSDIELEFGSFTDFEYKSARKDWPAVWKTWCRNWKKWKSERKPGKRLTYAEQIAADLSANGTGERDSLAGLK